MSKIPLVSIIIPVFNRIDHTIKAVESALKQTYRSIEIIVVDDGSVDDTASRILEFNSSEVKLIKHPENLGANKARNTGLDASKGDWIAFLDSDDTWHHSKVKKIIDKLIANPDYAVGYCSMNMFKNGSLESVFVATESGNLFENLLVENIVGSASVPIIKKTVFEKIKGMDNSLKSAQDWDLWLRIADEGYLFLAVPDRLVNYKIPDSDDHISGSFDAFWDGRRKFLEKHIHRYSNHKPALGQVYSKTGFLLMNRFNKRKLARQCFLKALNYAPLELKFWKGFLGTLVPTKLYNKFFFDGHRI